MKQDVKIYAIIGAAMDEASGHCFLEAVYQAFLNCDALRHELSWTAYHALLPGVNSDALRRKSGAPRSLEIGCAVSSQSIPHAMPTSSWICHAMRGESAPTPLPENKNEVP